MSGLDKLENLLVELHLTDPERAQLQPLLQLETLDPGQLILSEGIPNPKLHFVLEGSLHVSKKNAKGESQTISQVVAPVVLGEVSAILHELPVASVTTRSSTLSYTLNTEALKKLNSDALERKLLQFASKTLSQKIQTSNEKLVTELQKKVAHLEEKRRQAIFLTQIFVGLALYLFALNAFKLLENYLPADTLISGGVIIGFTAALTYALKKSGAPLALYGIHSQNWRAHIWQSLLYTLPLLALAIALKTLWVWSDSSGSIQLIQPQSIFSHPSEFTWSKWALAATAYCVLSIAQELISRSGIQCTLRFLFQDPDTPHAQASVERKAIFVSSLLFSATHTHLGAAFSAITFIPGLFWAWMFARQNSIIGAAFSHILLGLIVVFVLGVPV